MRWFVAVLLLTIGGGCATKYQEMGFTGGVTAEPVMTDVFRIVARGNGYTSVDRVQDFALLKAAETTIAAGGNYFVVVNEADRTNVVSGQTPATMQTSVVGRTAYIQSRRDVHLREAGRSSAYPRLANKFGPNTTVRRISGAGYRQHNWPAPEDVVSVGLEKCSRSRVHEP